MCNDFNISAHSILSNKFFITRLWIFALHNMEMRFEAASNRQERISKLIFQLLLWLSALWDSYCLFSFLSDDEKLTVAFTLNNHGLVMSLCSGLTLWSLLTCNEIAFLLYFLHQTSVLGAFVGGVGVYKKNLGWFLLLVQICLEVC